MLKYIHMIKDQIKKDLIVAMKAHDEVAKNTLKGLLSAFTNEVIANGGTPQSEVTDEVALKIIKRLSKQRKDAIAQYKQGGRDDLVENETAELQVLEKYMPEQMSEEEIRKIAEAKKEELGVKDMSKMGIFARDGSDQSGGGVRRGRHPLPRSELFF